MQRILDYTKQLIVALVLVAGATVWVAPLAVEAVSPQQQACKGAGGTWSGGKCSQSGVKTLETSIRDVVNLLFFVIGTVTVIVIIVGGIKFITADGDASKVKSARDTILYAVVGLVIAILAYAVVGFIVDRFA